MQKGGVPLRVIDRAADPISVRIWWRVIAVLADADTVLLAGVAVPQTEAPERFRSTTSLSPKRWNLRNEQAWLLKYRWCGGGGAGFWAQLASSRQPGLDGAQQLLNRTG
jgi:hypothetical protein